jgi:integrase
MSTKAGQAHSSLLTVKGTAALLAVSEKTVRRRVADETLVAHRNPLPKGFLPRASSNRAKSSIYPSEDLALLQCKKVSLVARVFFGILSREGLRTSEALQLTWGDVDLERGVLVLDENKTDERRSWPLDFGCARALRIWKNNFANARSSSARILVDKSGKSIDAYSAASLLRDSLKLCHHRSDCAPVPSDQRSTEPGRRQRVAPGRADSRIDRSSARRFAASASLRDGARSDGEPSRIEAVYGMPTLVHASELGGEDAVRVWRRVPEGSAPEALAAAPIAQSACVPRRRAFAPTGAPGSGSKGRVSRATLGG